MKLSKVEIFGLDSIIHSPWNSKWKSWDEWSLSINKGGSGSVALSTIVYTLTRIMPFCNGTVRWGK